MRPPTGRRPYNGAQPPRGGSKRPPRGGSAWKRFDKRWLVFVPVFFIVLLAAMYASIACSMAEPGDIILGKKGLEILDRNGNVIYTIGDEPGSSRIVPLEEISPNLINATIATEDANFWDNPGVNIKGLMRAAYENVAFWEGGFFHGSGGSSITQQLAKNLYIPPDERVKRSPLRKLKETMIAFELSRRYDKEDILQWYLSNIFYGQGAYGIESAAYRYLNKPPADLTLPEAAMLAGIPRSPNYYDPITNYEAAKARQEEVLDLMARHDIISKEEAAAAKAEPVVIREGRIPQGEGGDDSEDVAVHFALYVRDLLPSLIGQQDAQKQLRVTTTLDYDMQVKANQALVSNLDKFEPQYGASNGALVAMDPKTGEILAMVGSHDFSRDDISGQVNNALALNQPGSTMKPITYMAAFLKGWQPNTMILDEPIKIDNGSEGDITLNNADQRYRGNVTARVALGSSLNVPAVKALRYATLPTVYDLAKKMGITTLKDVENYGDAFTLGGADTTLLDMTYVYSVFANQGNRAGMSTVQDLPSGSRTLDPIAILKIETVDGKTLWSAKQRTERVVQANAAYLITNILSDDNARVSGFGANSALNLRSRPAAVKTGSSDATRDAWSIGYTPSLVTGVWVGNANNAPMPGGTSTLLAAPIWNQFMTAALEGEAPEQFTIPDGIRREGGEVFMDGNARAGTPTPEATATKEKETATPSVSPTERTGTPTRTPTQQPGTPTRTPTRDPFATSTPNPTSTPLPTNTRPPAATSTRPPNSTATPNPTSTPQTGTTPQTNQQNNNQQNNNGGNGPGQ
ncbi:MAG: transglycosylase domain-containing protein [Dehalococcoidia bacterium]